MASRGSIDSEIWMFAGHCEILEATFLVTVARQRDCDTLTIFVQHCDGMREVWSTFCILHNEDSDFMIFIGQSSS